MIHLDQFTADFADALVEIDANGSSYKAFQSGIGPYSEPVAVKAAVTILGGR